MRERFDAEAHEVLGLAAEEATAAGHGWVGTEHLLLGLLRSVCEARVGSAKLRRLLARPGLDRARKRVLEIIPPETADGARLGAVPTPRVERVLGHSVGLAADRSAGLAGAEHLLLGLLWEVDGIGARILAESGSGLSYGAAADALSIPVPDLPDPPDDASFGPEVDVSVEELEILLRELPGVIPPGCPIAFNLRGDSRAWVALGEGVDAEACVREVLSRS